jgi:hypothetical protein
LSHPHRRIAFVAVAVAVLAALIGASSAAAANVVNGSFETGTFEGWNVYRSNEGVNWFVEDAEEVMAPPFSGTHYAISFQGEAGTAILYQDVALEAGTTDQLQMAFGYESGAPIGIPTPDSLDAETSFENQQVRIDVMKPTAPIESLAPENILATVFASSPSNDFEGEHGEELAGLEEQLVTADLSQFAGQTVRLRIAVAVTKAPLLAEVDNVSINSTPIVTPAPAPTPAPPPPSNVFTKGKVTLNKKTGTATLSVSLPGAGTLTANDARSKVAMGSLAQAKSKPKAKPVLVKSTTLTSAGAGTVMVPIKPTAAAQKILAKKGKLPVKLRLTFAPTGGTPATQGDSLTLLKSVKPARK